MASPTPDKPMQILDTFPVLTPDMRVEALPFTGGMEFYEGLETKFGSFNKHVLVSCHEFNEAWATWEFHPKGDEVVVLLSGTATMALLIDGEHQLVDVETPGEFVIVPQGIWHTAIAADNARMLFITPGEGTENLEEPPSS